MNLPAYAGSPGSWRKLPNRAMLRPASHLLSCLLAAAVPSIAPAQTAYELHQEALGQARAGGNIPWSPTQGLTWNNFRGQPQQGLFKAAETFSSVTYLIGCLGREP